MSTHRLLLQSVEYKSIRIRPYYDPASINSDKLSLDKITYLKSLISATIRYLKSIVKVKPVIGPLFINRCQRIWHYQDFKYSVCPMSDYSATLTCKYTTIPSEHIAESWYYDPSTFESTKYSEGGNGITDTDLIIYVSYSDAECSSDGQTLAWASICNLDQFGRPIAGTINFCANSLLEQNWKYDVGITLHELMHIMAMSSSLFDYFYDFNRGQFQNKESVLIASSENVFVATDKVKATACAHYGCNALPGAALENFGSAGTIGSHWENKFAQSELMCGTKYSAVAKLSALTLALLEDSGWYLVDYNFAETLNWGKQQGCAFFVDSSACVNEQFWCSDAKDDGCSH